MGLIFSFFNISDKPPLNVVLCEDLPVHPFLVKTNLVNLLRTSSTLQNSEEPPNKICRFDFELKENPIQTLTKFYSANQSVFVDKIEELICDAVQCEQKLKLSFEQKSLIECISSSKSLFGHLVKVFSRYLIETDFEQKIVDIFRKVVRYIHQTSQNPIELYPPCLVKLTSLITLHQDMKDISLIPHLKRELLEVLKSQSIYGKMMLLLFPESFCLDFDEFERNSSFTCMSTAITLLKLLK